MVTWHLGFSVSISSMFIYPCINCKFSILGEGSPFYMRMQVNHVYIHGAVGNSYHPEVINTIDYTYYLLSSFY